MSSFWDNLENFNVYSNESWGNNPTSSYEAGISDLNSKEFVSDYHPHEHRELPDLNDSISECEYSGEHFSYVEQRNPEHNSCYSVQPSDDDHPPILSFETNNMVRIFL